MSDGDSELKPVNKVMEAMKVQHYFNVNNGLIAILQSKNIEDERLQLIENTIFQVFMQKIKTSSLIKYSTTQFKIFI